MKSTPFLLTPAIFLIASGFVVHSAEAQERVTLDKQVSWVAPGQTLPLPAQVCTGNLAAEIKRLKKGSGKPLIAHDGGGFARSLIKTGLIDECRLLVHPNALGRGMPIFSELKNPMRLALIESIRFDIQYMMIAGLLFWGHMIYRTPH